MSRWSQVILSSVASQDDVLDRADLPRFMLSEISEDQAHTYLNAFTGTDEAWSNLPEAAKALAKNPQDLTIIAEITKNLGDPKKIPTQRAALYKEILSHDRPLAEWAETDAMQSRVIYAVAFRMFTEIPTLTEQRAGEWIRQAIEAETDKPAGDIVVTECLKSLRNSNLFRTESEFDNELGKHQFVISFRHELIGKFLAARHIRRLLQKSDEKRRKELFDQLDNETGLDVLGFVIDETDSKHELSALVRELIAHGFGVTLRAAGYALFRKPDLIEKAVKDFYTSKRIEEDTRRIVANAA
jgi:hypothetical protein